VAAVHTDTDSGPPTDRERRANGHRAPINSDDYRDRDRDRPPRNRDSRPDRDRHADPIQHADAANGDADKRGGGSRPPR
jgi:hypothetical protein